MTTTTVGGAVTKAASGGPVSIEALEADYAARNPRSRRQYELGRTVMPGGVAKGAYFSKPYPLFLVSGEGCYVTTLDGQRLLDCANHHTAGVLGHRHPAVMEAVREQLERGFALGGPTTVEYELAREMTERVPSLERVRFAGSGGEAAQNVLRLVRGWTGRQKIAKFEGAFHGRVDALEVSVGPPLDQAGPGSAPRAVPQGRGFERGAAADTVILPYRHPEAVERLLVQHRDELAAVWLDPRAGVLDADREFIRHMRGITEELDLLLVMDEVVAFRVGPGGLQEQCGIRPDLTTFGKIIGGGFPIGAFGGRADLMDLLDDARGGTGYMHSGTFHGHPVALAAGLATLRTLTPAAYEHLTALGDELRTEANALFGRLGVAAQAVGDGSLFGIHFTAEPLHNYRSLATADGEQAYRVHLQLLAQGVMLSSGLGMCALSLPMDRSHVAAVLAALERAVGG